MKVTGVWMSIAALCLTAAACSSPASVTTGGAYAGQWAGTTAQGRPIAFTISSSDAVTTITVGHDFNGCVGTETFSGLDLSVVPNVSCIPGPCPPSVSYHGFSYSSGSSAANPSTELNAVMLSTTSAQGSVNFRNFAGCGNAIGIAWTAARR